MYTYILYCVYIYIWLCMYMYIYIYTYIYIYIYMCTRVCVCVCISGLRTQCLSERGCRRELGRLAVLVLFRPRFLCCYDNAYPQSEQHIKPNQATKQKQTTTNKHFGPGSRRTSPCLYAMCRCAGVLRSGLVGAAPVITMTASSRD